MCIDFLQFLPADLIMYSIVYYPGYIARRRTNAVHSHYSSSLTKLSVSELEEVQTTKILEGGEGEGIQTTPIKS